MCGMIYVVQSNIWHLNGGVAKRKCAKIYKSRFSPSPQWGCFDAKRKKKKHILLSNKRIMTEEWC